MNDNEKAIRTLYEQLLLAWNRRDAAGMAAQFEKDGNVVGFDGKAASKVDPPRWWLHLRNNCRTRHSSSAAKLLTQFEKRATIVRIRIPYALPTPS